MSLIKMKRSGALAWVKTAIEREKYDVALDIVISLIEQEKQHELEEGKDNHVGTKRTGLQ